MPILLLSSLLALHTAASSATAAAAPVTPTWSAEEVATLLAATEEIRLAPDLTALSTGEQRALAELLAVGEEMQRLYEEQLHPEARAARAALAAPPARDADGERLTELRDLWRLFHGPIATTLDNRREPFLAVAPATPGKNVYPAAATVAEVEAFLAARPEQRGAILDLRTVVRRATAEALAADLATLRRHPALQALHPALGAELERLAARPDRAVLYAVPYAVAYADVLEPLSRRLFAAAAEVAPDDAELAGYLRNRARDLLGNDYESGDAAWVTGHFGRLNAQIGAYETYDDALFGVKAFHGMSVLVRDEAASAQLRRQLGALQAIEDALPYAPHGKVRDDIPVGIYDVVADFGQARGTNTATILPNDPLHTRRYGRTILMRRNILLHPAIHDASRRGWQAVMAPEHADELVPEGNFQRTLWHEIGHYLGPQRDRQGRPLDVALGDRADALEEMKADLVSLVAVHHLHATGAIDDATLAAVRAAGIRRTLLNNRPRREQAYQTMQLAQLNWFLEHGLLAAGENGRLRIDPARYAEVVGGLLGEVLKVQLAGDHAAADRFFERWTTWGELHGRIAERLRGAEGARFRLVRYAALGE